MHVPFLDLQAQYTALQPEVDAAIQRVLDSCAFAGGPEVAAFEQDFAKFCTTQHAIGVSSGTAALELLFRALDIGPGDEVIVPANTFFATAEAVALTGATVVFVDVLEKTGLMDSSLLEARITPKTKAVVPVHLWGQMADMESITAIAAAHNILVIEDSAQAHGAKFHNAMAGSTGVAAAFSFYPGKNLGAYGEAGAVTTNDANIRDRVCLFRDHGSYKKYEHQVVGRNDRMDGIQAAVLGVKLQHLPEWNAKRRQIAAWYRDGLSQVDTIQTFTEGTGTECVYHIFAVRVPERQKVQTALQERGIATGVHYPIPLHLQPAMTSLGYTQGDFPVAEQLATEILSLPMYPECSQEQIEYVIESLQDILASLS